MYIKEFTPIAPKDIRKVNASALARQFNCTSAYVGRIMKVEEAPKNKKAQAIHEAARDIITKYKLQ